MRRLLPFLLLLPALSACEKAADAPVAGGAPSAVAPSPEATASAAPPVANAAAREVSISNDSIEFEYAYPATAASIPALKALLDGELARSQSEVEQSARAWRKEAKENNIEFQPHGSWTGWQVVTDNPGWLSLSAQISSYTGGAHPNHGFDALLWDKAAGQRRKAADLFVSPQQLSKAIRAEFCRQIDLQREEKRGEKVDRKSPELFNECIDPLASTLILGSSNRKTFDRIGVLVAPYEAGAYAEGSYEATLPVTPAILALVKPEYRASFSVKR